MDYPSTGLSHPGSGGRSQPLPPEVPTGDRSTVGVGGTTPSFPEKRRNQESLSVSGGVVRPVSVSVFVVATVPSSSVVSGSREDFSKFDRRYAETLTGDPPASADTMSMNLWKDRTTTPTLPCPLSLSSLPVSSVPFGPLYPSPGPSLPRGQPHGPLTRFLPPVSTSFYSPP